MFENTSRLCIGVILDAVNWSIKQADPVIGYEHLLLALVENDTLIAKCFSEKGVDLARILTVTKARALAEPEDCCNKDGRSIFETAEQVRMNFGHKTLFSDHLSIALIRKYPALFEAHDFTANVLEETLVERLQVIESLDSNYEWLSDAIWEASSSRKISPWIARRDVTSVMDLLVRFSICLSSLPFPLPREHIVAWYQNSASNMREPYEFLHYKFKSKDIQRSLESVLNAFLYEAETLFGPRLSPYPYEFRGIEFAKKHPQIQFLDTNDTESVRNTKCITIRLSEDCKDDIARALWQLTHEVVHLLAPVPESEITVLEEGIACWYQRHWVGQCPTIFPDWTQTANLGYARNEMQYIAAIDLVSTLLSRDSDGVRKLRQLEPVTSKITPALMRTVFPDIGAGFANAITARFSKVRHSNKRHKCRKL